MDNDLIQIVLVNIKYKNKKIDKLKELGEEEYPWYFDSPKMWNAGEIIEVVPYQHYFAIKCSSKGDEIIQEVIDSKGNKFDEFQIEEDIFYVQPWGNSMHTTVGEVEVVIRFKDNRTEHMTVKSLDEDLQVTYLKQMMDDLLKIHYCLCRDKASSITVPLNKTQYLVDRINQFYELCKIIENHPIPDLQASQIKVASYNMKKITPKALIQKATSQGKIEQSYNIESLDTFEHRVIKTSILDLKKSINYQIETDKKVQVILQNRNKKINGWKDISYYEEKYKDVDKIIKENNEAKLREIRENGELLSEVLNKLVELESSYLFRNVGKERVKPRLSNLFKYNSCYKKIYQIITDNSIQNMLLGVSINDYSGDDNISVKKISEVYEAWVLISILDAFIEKYSFHFILDKEEEFDSRSALAEYIEKFIKNGEIRDSEFVLQNEDLDLKVTIFYQRSVHIDAEKLKNEGKLHHNKARHDIIEDQLTPDYLLSIEKISNSYSKKWFVLDAKYRFGKELDDDVKLLAECAFQKYTLELSASKELVTNISGSFILHNAQIMNEPISINQPEGYESKYDPQLYLGQTPDVFINDWLSTKKINPNEVVIEEFIDWCKWQPGNDSNENKIGILKMSFEENKFPYLVQMIMELYFDKGRELCWLCGSDKLKEIPKPIYSQFNIDITDEEYRWSYKIKCENCSEFWIKTHCDNGSCLSDPHRKLVKHWTNYYPNKKGSRFFVCCPCCRHEPSKIRNKPKKNEEKERLRDLYYSTFGRGTGDVLPYD